MKKINLLLLIIATILCINAKTINYNSEAYSFSMDITDLLVDMSPEYYAPIDSTNIFFDVEFKHIKSEFFNLEIGKEISLPLFSYSIFGFNENNSTTMFLKRNNIDISNSDFVNEMSDKLTDPLVKSMDKKMMYLEFSTDSIYSDYNYIMENDEHKIIVDIIYIICQQEVIMLTFIQNYDESSFSQNIKQNILNSICIDGINIINSKDRVMINYDKEYSLNIPKGFYGIIPSNRNYEFKIVSKKNGSEINFNTVYFPDSIKEQDYESQFLQFKKSFIEMIKSNSANLTDNNIIKRTGGFEIRCKNKDIEKYHVFHLTTNTNRIFASEISSKVANFEEMSECLSYIEFSNINFKDENEEKQFEIFPIVFYFTIVSVIIIVPLHWVFIYRKRKKSEKRALNPFLLLLIVIVLNIIMTVIIATQLWPLIERLWTGYFIIIQLFILYTWEKTSNI